MPDYAAGDSYYGGFTTSDPATGAATDADSTPTATANTNGTDDAAFVLTCTKIDTGRYKITGTVPAGYNVGDVVWIYVTAVMGGVTGKAPADHFKVASLAADTAAALLAAVYEGTETVQDFLRLARASLYGVATDQGTTSPKFRDLADAKDRITSTCDTSGNRSVVTLDAT